MSPSRTSQLKGFYRRRRAGSGLSDGTGDGKKPAGCRTFHLALPSDVLLDPTKDAERRIRAPTGHHGPWLLLGRYLAPGYRTLRRMGADGPGGREQVAGEQTSHLCRRLSFRQEQS